MLNLLNQWVRPVIDGVKAVHWTVMLLLSIDFSKHWPLDYDTINQVIDTAQVDCQKSSILLLKVSYSCHSAKIYLFMSTDSGAVH